MAEGIRWSDDRHDGLADERRSKVTFDIEPTGQMVKLTVIHDDLEPDWAVAEAVSGGWPVVRSALKTLLETGQNLRAVSAESSHAAQDSQP